MYLAQLKNLNHRLVVSRKFWPHLTALMYMVANKGFTMVSLTLNFVSLECRIEGTYNRSCSKG